MARVNIGSALHVKSYTAEKIYNGVSMNSYAMVADEEGVAQELPKLDLDYSGITEITEKGLSKAKIKIFAMYALETVRANDAFSYASGYNDSVIKGVYFPKLELVKGDNAFAYAWYNCQNIDEIDIHSLRDISGKNVMSHAFYRIYSNTSTCGETMDLSNLEYIGHLGDNPEDNENACNYMFYSAKFKHLNMPKLKVINGYRACYQMFDYCSELLDFPGWNELVEINGDEACYQMFGYCTKINTSDISNKAFNFPKLKRIIGNSIFYGLFYNSSVHNYTINAPLLEEIHGNSIFSNDGSNYATYYISNLSSLRIVDGNYIFYKLSGSLNLPALQYIKGTSTFSSLCTSSTSTTVSLPELLEIEGTDNFYNCWNNNYVTTIDFPKLKKINGSRIFYVAFSLSSTSATTTTNPVSFDSLDEIIETGTSATSYNFYGAFRYRKNVSVSFPALKSTSFNGSAQTFTSNNHPFYNMFMNGSNNTIHLPSNLENVVVGSTTMGSWILSGTNNTIVFDLEPTE